MAAPETPPPSKPQPVRAAPQAAAAPSIAPAPPEPRTVLEIAADLRASEPSNPVPYLLVRSWQFGPLIERGAVIGMIVDELVNSDL